MPSSTLGRKLAATVLGLFLVPTLLVGLLLLGLYRLGVYEEPAAAAVTLVLGLLTMVAYLGGVTYLVGRSLVRTLREIQVGTELIATVNPRHRLEVRTGDEMQALAEEINRMADRVGDARSGLEREVARATLELAAERATLSAVLAALGEGVVVATAEGRVTLANQAAQTLLGAGDGSLLGRSLFDLVDREKVVHFLDRLRPGAGGAERFTLHPARGRLLETVMTPLPGEARGTAGFVLVLRDLTGPARSEEERRRLLAEALPALRGPLASIRSLSESLLADPPGAAGASGRLLAAIHAEAVRLSGLVREMDEPARLGLARPPWHFERISVADLIGITRRRLGSGGSGLEVDGALATLPPLRAEASALSGVLAHLAAAVLARGEPGGTARLRPAERGRLVQIDLGAPGRGLGADLETLLDAPVPAGVAGPVTAREVVRQHAGEVWAYADAGRLGFRLTLPAAEAGEPEGATAAAARGAFVGAGLLSGQGAAEGVEERPDFYDFTLFEQIARDLPAADRDRPLDEVPCVAFDLETTGLDPDGGDRIVSVAGVRIRRGAVRRSETFDALVNPARLIPASSVRFHGITDAMVAEAPPIDVVLPAFLRFAGGAVLVGHQVSFDLRFLAVEAHRLGLPPPTLGHPALDTLLLSEVVHGRAPAHGLDAVAARLGVAIRGRHSALGDALATAEVFTRLVVLLSKRGVRTLGQAIDASRRARGPDEPASAPRPPGI